VVHGDHGIIVAPQSVVEQGIGRERSGYINTLLPASLHGWTDDGLLFGAQLAAFAGVRV